MEKDLEPGVDEENSGLNAAFEEKSAIGIRRSSRNKERYAWFGVAVYLYIYISCRFVQTTRRRIQQKLTRLMGSIVVFHRCRRQQVFKKSIILVLIIIEVEEKDGGKYNNINSRSIV